MRGNFVVTTCASSKRQPQRCTQYFVSLSSAAQRHSGDNSRELGKLDCTQDQVERCEIRSGRAASEDSIASGCSPSSSGATPARLIQNTRNPNAVAPAASQKLDDTYAMSCLSIASASTAS